MGGVKGTQAQADALWLNPTLVSFVWTNDDSRGVTLARLWPGKLAPELLRLEDRAWLAHWRHTRGQSKTAFLLLASRTVGGNPTASLLNTQVLFDWQVLRTVFFYSGLYFPSQALLLQGGD
jgi:hypothetical protein